MDSNQKAYCIEVLAVHIDPLAKSASRKTRVALSLSLFTSEAPEASSPNFGRDVSGRFWGSDQGLTAGVTIARANSLRHNSSFASIPSSNAQ